MNREMVRAFGRTLAETEWLPAEDLHAYQAPLLAKLLQHARTTTEFYRDKLDIDPDYPQAIEKTWSRIPILTRAEAVANNHKLMSRNVPAETGGVFEDVTSGSTGIPFSGAQSEMTVIAATALSERMLRWWSGDGRKCLAQISYDRFNKAPPPMA